MKKDFDFGGIFSSIFGNNHNNKSSARKAKQQRRGRIARIEELESREMLSVTFGEFEAMRLQYADLYLQEFADEATYLAQDRYNIIEVGGTDENAKEATQAGLQAAIDEAISETETLIVIRGNITAFTTTTNTSGLNITTAGTTVSIVGWGGNGTTEHQDTPFEGSVTLDAGSVDGRRVLNVGAGTTVTLAGLTITGGRLTATTSLGAGIQNEGNLTLTYCEVTNNSIQTQQGNNSTRVDIYGGGIFNETTGTLTLRNSQVVGNDLEISAATGNGANVNAMGSGIFSSGTLVLTNSLVAANQAKISGGNQGTRYARGGGIYINAGELTLTNCTIAGNLVQCEGSSGNAQGGGVYFYAGTTVSIYNSIIVGNIAGASANNDLNGSSSTVTLTGANNIFGTVNTDFGAGACDASYLFGFTGTIGSTNTGLFFNADSWNGLKLVSGAADAINKGNNESIKGTYYDLAGNARLADENVSIGAYEYKGETINKADYAFAIEKGWIYNSHAKLTWGEGETEESRRITEITLNDSVITNLDLRVLTELKSADLTDCSLLVTLNVDGTALLFSTLTLPGSGVAVEGKTTLARAIVDSNLVCNLSEENVNDSTSYTWYYQNDSLIEGTIYTEKNGVFTFHGLKCGETIYCVMTNENFDEMKVRTKEINVPERLDAPVLYDLDGHDTNSLEIHWLKVEGAAGYRIQWSTDETFEDADLLESATDFETHSDHANLHYFVIKDLDEGETYFVRVMALTGEEGSAISQWSAVKEYITASSDDTQISAPTAVTATDSTATTMTIEWEWEGDDDHPEEFGEFLVEWSLTIGFEHVSSEHRYIETEGTSCTIYGLEPGQTYYVRVKALSTEDGYRYSAWSVWQFQEDEFSTIDYAETDKGILYLLSEGAKGKAAEGHESGFATWEKDEDNNVMRLVGLDFTKLESGDADLEIPFDASVFTELVALNVSDCGLTELILTSLEKLVTLDCSGNELTELDVSDCTALEKLNVSGNKLTALDVSGCTALEELNVSGNKLTKLNLIDCESLATLNVTGCGLTFGTLTLPSTWDASKDFICESDPITLEMSSMDSSYAISADSPRTIDFSKYIDAITDSGETKYEWRYCDGDEPLDEKDYMQDGDKFSITNSDLIGENICCVITNTFYGDLALITSPIKIFGETPEGIDAQDYDTITDGLGDFIDLDGVDLTNPDNGVAWFDEESGKLIGLNLADEDMADLDDKALSDLLNSLTDLEDLNLSGVGGVTELDISGLENLETLDVHGMDDLVTLNLEGCTNLKELDVSGCENLEELIFPGGSSSQDDEGIKLDLNEGLRILKIPGHKNLKELDVSGCELLEELDLSGSSLTELDLSENTALKELNVSGCELLEELDLSNNEDLEKLNIDGTKLTFATLTLPESFYGDIEGTIVVKAEYDASEANTLPSNWSVDLSENDHSSDNVKGNTTYVWHLKDEDGTERELVKDTDYEVDGGVFTFTGLKAGDEIYCVMTNSAYGGMTLETESITIRGAVPAGLNVEEWDAIVELLGLDVTGIETDSFDKTFGDLLEWSDVGNLTGIDITKDDDLVNLPAETTLDLSVFTSLVNVNLTNLELASLNVSGCEALEELTITGCGLTFSTLLLPDDFIDDGGVIICTGATKIEISPSTLVVGTPLDLSANPEFGIEGNEYEWFIYREGDAVSFDDDDDAEFDTDADGVFTFTGLNAGDEIYCVISNPAYGELTGLTLQTSNIVIQAAATPPGDVTDAQVKGEPTVNSIMILWTAPSSPGTIVGGETAVITGYTVKYATKAAYEAASGNAGFWSSASAATVNGTEATASGLQASTEYVFFIVATNSAVLSSMGVTIGADGNVKTAALAAPGQVSKPSAVQQGDNNVTVTWTKPSTGGEPAHYEIRYQKSGDTGWTVIEDNNNDPVQFEGLTHTVPALTPGTYFFQVRAVNDTDDGVWSVNSDGVTITAALAAPGKVSKPSAVKEGDNDVVVTWTKPAGGEPAYYEIQYSTDNGESWTIIEDSDGDPARFPGLTHTVPALPQGTYVFQVQAVNNTDAGGWSESSDPVEITAALAAPGQVDKPSAAKHEDNDVVVTWTEPEGGEPDHYEIRYSTDNGTNWIYLRDSSEDPEKFTGSSHTVYALPQGTYVFSVRAVNKTDAGEWSENSNSVTITAALEVPGQVDKPSAHKEGTNAVTVNWTKPEGGEPAHYEIRYQKTGDSGWTYLPATVAGLTHTVHALPQGTYVFSVQAVNNTDAGEWSESSDPVEITAALAAPGKVSKPSAVKEGDNDVVVTWTKPAGGEPAYYEIQYSTDNGESWTIIEDSDGDPARFPGLTHTVSALPQGTYVFSVRAVNDTDAGGWSDNCDSVTITLAPNAPIDLQVTNKTSTTVTFTWKDPVIDNNHSAATNYQIWYRLGTGETGFTLLPFGQGAAGEDGIYAVRSESELSVTVFGLAPNTYSFYIIAVNDAGLSPQSQHLTASTAPSEPWIEANTAGGTKFSDDYLKGQNMTNGKVDSKANATTKPAAPKVNASNPLGIKTAADNLTAVGFVIAPKAKNGNFANAGDEGDLLRVQVLAPKMKLGDFNKLTAKEKEQYVALQKVLGGFEINTHDANWVGDVVTIEDGDLTFTIKRVSDKAVAGGVKYEVHVGGLQAGIKYTVLTQVGKIQEEKKTWAKGNTLSLSTAKFAAVASNKKSTSTNNVMTHAGPGQMTLSWNDGKNMPIGNGLSTSDVTYDIGFKIGKFVIFSANDFVWGTGANADKIIGIKRGTDANPFNVGITKDANSNELKLANDTWNLLGENFKYDCNTTEKSIQFVANFPAKFKVSFVVQANYKGTASALATIALTSYAYPAPKSLTIPSKTIKPTDPAVFKWESPQLKAGVNYPAGCTITYIIGEYDTKKTGGVVNGFTKRDGLYATESGTLNVGSLVGGSKTFNSGLVSIGGTAGATNGKYTFGVQVVVTHGTFTSLDADNVLATSAVKTLGITVKP